MRSAVSLVSTAGLLAMPPLLATVSCSFCVPVPSGAQPTESIATSAAPESRQYCFMAAPPARRVPRSSSREAADLFAIPSVFLMRFVDRGPKPERS
jgi:hypothetical protein